MKVFSVVYVLLSILQVYNDVVVVNGYSTYYTNRMHSKYIMCDAEMDNLDFVYGKLSDQNTIPFSSTLKK